MLKHKWVYFIIKSQTVKAKKDDRTLGIVSGLWIEWFVVRPSTIVTVLSDLHPVGWILVLYANVKKAGEFAISLLGLILLPMKLTDQCTLI